MTILRPCQDCITCLEVDYRCCQTRIGAPDGLPANGRPGESEGAAGVPGTSESTIAARDRKQLRHARRPPESEALASKDPAEPESGDRNGRRDDQQRERRLQQHEVAEGLAEKEPQPERRVGDEDKGP